MTSTAVYATMNIIQEGSRKISTRRVRTISKINMLSYVCSQMKMSMMKAEMIVTEKENGKLCTSKSFDLKDTMPVVWWSLCIHLSGYE